MANPTREVILFIGFLDALGRRMVETLLARNPDTFIYLLAREADMGLAKRSAEEIAERLARQGLEVTGQIHPLNGIITQERLGIAPSIFKILTETVTQVWHFAGVHDLNGPKNVAYKVHIIGSRRVLDFSRLVKNLNRVVCLSSAYVSGDRTGLVMEHELDESQGFHNFLESTQFRAELETRQAMSDLPVIVLRPGMIWGDSTTGVAGPPGPMTYFLEFFRRIKDRLSDPALEALGWLHASLGGPHARIPAVPIDYIAQAAVLIAQSPDAVGNTFHLVPETAPAAREVYQAMCRYAGIGLARGFWSPRHAARFWSLPLIDRFTGIPPDCLPYFNHTAEYQARNTRRLLKGSGLLCPSPMDYLEKIVGYAMSHPAGRGAAPEDRKLHAA